MNFLDFENSQGGSLAHAEQAKLLTQGRIMIPPKKVEKYLKEMTCYLLQFDPELRALRIIFYDSEERCALKTYKMQKHGNGSVYVGNLSKIFKNFNLRYEVKKNIGTSLDFDVKIEEEYTYVTFYLKGILTKGKNE